MLASGKKSKKSGPRKITDGQLEAKENGYGYGVWRREKENRVSHFEKMKPGDEFLRDNGEIFLSFGGLLLRDERNDCRG